MSPWKKAAALGALLFARVLLADDWPGQQVMNIFSDDGSHFVRILPGESLGDTFGFAGAAKGAYAKAELYERQPNRSYALVADIQLVNPIGPIEAMLANSGHLITFDNWHNAGYGKVIALYDPRGKLIKAYELEQLYDEARLGKIPMSISSRWWRCRHMGWVDPPQQTKVFVFEHLGGNFAFRFADGGFEYSPGEAECQRR